MIRRRRTRGVTSVMFAMGVALLAASALIIAGTAQRYLQKEIIQDSADAAAMAGAIIRAKALNLIAFENLLMAVLLAVYIFLKGVALGMTMYLPIGSSLCLAGQLDFCTYQPKAADVLQSYASAALSLAGDLMSEASQERSVAEAVPALAVVEAYRAGTDVAFQRNYGSGLVVSAVPNGPQPLPLADESAARFHNYAMEHDAPIVFPIGFALLMQNLKPGPDQPVNLAFAFSAIGVTTESGIVDAPALPLRLADDWPERRFFRTRSELGQNGGGNRERLASVAFGAPAASGQTTQATSQGEFFAFYSHEDLWHMGWRARLSLSKPFVPVPDYLRDYWVH